MKFMAAESALRDAQKLHFEGAENGNDAALNEAEQIYNAVFNKNWRDPNVFYLLGTLYMNRGFNALGGTLLQLCLSIAPKFAEAWNNLGICYKNEFMKKEASRAFTMAAKERPNDPNMPSNHAGVYINEGEPEKCLELSEKALAIDPTHVQSLWHKGLALLELQRFGEAWPFHEARLHGGAKQLSAVRNYAAEGVTPWWDGKAQGLVVIHGEQGLGDEIMFATCIPEIVERHKDCRFVFECAPRMEALFRRSLPCEVYGTHELDGRSWRKEGEDVDYKVALGSLAMHLGRNVDKDFPGTPYLVPDRDLRAKFRQRLRELGPRPKIGIAWQGGALITRIELRTIPLLTWMPILSQEADFISLQYTAAAKEEIEAFTKESGVVIHHWDECARGAKGLDEQAALIKELDLVISVCQTAVHVSGAVGTECWCLTPSRPAWRYGVTGNMPWYGSVTLYRQKGDNWASVIERVANDLRVTLAIAGRARS